MTTSNIRNRETDILEVIRELEAVRPSSKPEPSRVKDLAPDPVALKDKMVSNLEKYRILKNGGITLSSDDGDLEKKMEDAIKDLDDIIGTII